MEYELFCDFDNDVTRPMGRINAGISCAAPVGDEQHRSHLPLGQSTSLRGALINYYVKQGIG